MSEITDFVTGKPLFEHESAVDLFSGNRTSVSSTPARFVGSTPSRGAAAVRLVGSTPSRDAAVRSFGSTWTGPAFASAQSRASNSSVNLFANSYSSSQKGIAQNSILLHSLYLSF